MKVDVTRYFYRYSSGGALMCLAPAEIKLSPISFSEMEQRSIEKYILRANNAPQHQLLLQLRLKKSFRYAVICYSP